MILTNERFNKNQFLNNKMPLKLENYCNLLTQKYYTQPNKKNMLLIRSHMDNTYILTYKQKGDLNVPEFNF